MGVVGICILLLLCFLEDVWQRHRGRSSVSDRYLFTSRVPQLWYAIILSVLAQPQHARKQREQTSSWILACTEVLNCTVKNRMICLNGQE